MKIYPTTDQPVWGQATSWQGIDNWYSTLNFSSAQPTVQEVIPVYEHLSAEIYIQGTAAHYRLEFPGGKRDFYLSDGEARLDVSDLITTGKHLYHIDAETEFEATVRIYARRPLVKASDEGYLIDWRSLPEGERQQMVGDRPAHRVGSWPAWIKVLPADSRYTRFEGEIISLDEALYRQPEAIYEADFSGQDLDDSQWLNVQLPHEVHDANSEGYVWYRLYFPLPDHWHDETIVLRQAMPDSEALAYINGHTVGYHQPNERPLQFDISRYVKTGDYNVLTLRLTKSAGTKLHMYPVQIGRIERYGLVLMGRFFPAQEDAIEVSLFDATTDLEPVGFGPETSLLYRPPEIRLLHLSSDNQPYQLRAMAAEEQHSLIFDISTAGEAAWWLALRLDMRNLGYRTLKVKSSDTYTLQIYDSEDQGQSLWLHMPGLVSWLLVENWDREHIPANSLQESSMHSVHLLLHCRGSSVLTVSRMDGTEGRDYDAALRRWDQEVYRQARPLLMDDVQAAAWRSSKQTVLLNARNVPQDVAHGLLAAFDKPVFHVYWMRDCAISTPGAIYTGGEARRTAFENIGPTLDRYASVPECIGIYPDGTPREGGFSDGPALGVWAQGYGHSLLGNSWLMRHDEAVQQQIAYLLERDGADGDPVDGIIRSSNGDWKDAGSMRRLWRVGAVFFVNVAYLRALRVAAEMSRNLNWLADADHLWNLHRSGVAMMNLDVADGGYWMADYGYYADWVQVDGRKSWAYPRDKADITVFTAFSSVAHGMALAEGLIPPERIPCVVEAIERFQLLDPVPAPAKYPFYDVLAETGQKTSIAESLDLSNPWKLKEFFPNLPDWLSYDMVLPWKGWPGNHVWGGRWLMAGAWLTLGLWRAGYTELARRSQDNLARALLRVRHPGRCEETESYSAVSREETGSHTDPAGYYQLWSGAVPLQSLIEGAYGIIPCPGGFSLDLRHYRPGDGIECVPVRGGSVTCIRTSIDMFTIELNTDIPGHIELTLASDARDFKGVQVARHTGNGKYKLAYLPNSRIQILLTAEVVS